MSRYKKRTSRKYELRDQRLAKYFHWKYYRQYRSLTNVSLGPYRRHSGNPGLTPAELRLTGVNRARADMIIVTPDELVVVEAKVKPDYESLMSLVGYRALLPRTPEMEHYKHLPIKAIYVSGQEDDWLAERAQELDVEFIQADLQWATDYLDKLRSKKRVHP